MKNIVTYANLLLLALNLSALVTIIYKGHLETGGSEETTSPIEEALALSPQQIHTIQATRQTFNNDWGRIDEEIRAAREALLIALKEDDLSDAASVWPLVEELTELQAELEMSAVTQLFQEKKLLTPQQQEQYFTRVENRMREGCGCMRRFRGGRQNDLGRGGPPSGAGKGRGEGRRQRR
jgi:Spy/CpxP family protein refolding chaperone